MLVNYRDKYTEMHGQQNVKKKILVRIGCTLPSILFYVGLLRKYSKKFRMASPQTEIRTHDLFNTKQQCPFQHIVGLGGRWNVRLFKLWRVSKVCRMEPIHKRSLIVMLEAYGGEYVTELPTNHVIILLQPNRRSHLSLGWLDTPG